MSINTEFFKLAVEAAAPSLAALSQLGSPSAEWNAANTIVNAYHAIVAAHQQIVKAPLKKETPGSAS